MLSGFRTEIVRRAYGYWDSKRRGSSLPGRADIDPGELRDLLPHIFLVDVHRDPVGFRFRLVGTAITQCAGMNHTGRWIDAADYGPEWKHVFDTYLRVVQTGMADLIERQAPWPSRDFVHYERLIAPLAADGRTVDMLFGALKSVPTGRACSEINCPGRCR